MNPARRPADDRPLSRRELLLTSAGGFGALAMAGLLGCDETAPRAATSPVAGPRPFAGQRAARAKHVIYLFMSGGPSHLDLFDPKPRLDKEDGQPIKMNLPELQFSVGGQIMRSPFKFKQHGESGAWVSEVFPHLAQCVDDLCFVKSMVADHGEHGTGNVFMNTGHGRAGRPSMGAWINYGLGSESENLPGYVVLESGRTPVGGNGCFGNGFLPARYQGAIFKQGAHPVPNLEPAEPTNDVQLAKLRLARRMNERFAAQWAAHSELEAVIANQELAYQMQSVVPELVDTSRESAAMKKLYGLDDPKTAPFGSQCLLARKLVEQGVRFVQLLPPRIERHDQWDQHANIETGHRENAEATDKPIAGLIADLKARGMLEDTLILWGGEFGRTPIAHVNPGQTVMVTGRGHNRFGFTVWMAGAGVKPGFTYGGTDDYGFYAFPDQQVTVHDLHATILHLLGIDHTQLTYRHGGRDYRLTDVYGRVVDELLL